MSADFDVTKYVQVKVSNQIFGPNFLLGLLVVHWMENFGV